jgi:DNA-binding NarL/FixJ family response regulator
MAIRIILADDHKIVRESFRALLANDPQFEVVADVGDGESAVKTTLEHKPDIVVMDMTMPIVSGEEATRQILAVLPNTRIIALSMHTHPRAISSMLKAGAKAFIPKTSKAAELIQAIRAISQGETYIAPGLAIPADSMPSEQESPPADVSLTALSAREHQILTLIADGCDTHKIAAKLELSKKTVATHRTHTMKKLNIHTIAGLTKYAIREGISSI